MVQENSERVYLENRWKRADVLLAVTAAYQTHEWLVNHSAGKNINKDIWNERYLARREFIKFNYKVILKQLKSEQNNQSVATDRTE